LRAILGEHLASVLVVGCVLVCLGVVVSGKGDERGHHTDSRIERYLSLDGVDWSIPLHRELFRDSYRAIHAASEQAVDSVVESIQETRQAEMADPARKLGGEKKTLSWGVLGELVPMYLGFLAVFVVVLVLTYAAARAIAVWKFIVWKQGRASPLRQFLYGFETGGLLHGMKRLDLLVKALLHGVSSFLLFSPAYVIAYSLRTRLDTENVLFLVLLAVVSNGVLVHYAHRLYTLLVSESRKGYVESALVKGVRGAYAWNASDGISPLVIVRPILRAEGHVFREIYRNARLQFIPSTKEHVTFIVTGLVIIEMALNIKGHLCYALLQHILFKEFDIAIAIVLLIFIAVKLVEAGVDVWQYRELRKYDNAG
jgi:hypothetical protein